MGAFMEDGSVGICQLAGPSVYCDPHETKGESSDARFEGIEADSLHQSMVADYGRAGYQPNMEVAWPK